MTMTSSSKISSGWFRIFALAVSIPAITVLFLLAYLGAHTRLIADDFCSAYFAKRLGLLRSVWYWYNNWSGRYTAFGTDWLMEKIGVHALPVIPPLALFIWLTFTVVAFQLSLRYVLPQNKSKLAALSLGTVFLFVVLLLSPNIQQSLYWWNGMRSYGLPLILLTLYLVLLQIGAERLKTRSDKFFIYIHKWRAGRDVCRFSSRFLLFSACARIACSQRQNIPSIPIFA